MDFARGRLGGGMQVEIGELVPLAPALWQVVTKLQGSMPDRVIQATIDVPVEFRCDSKRISQLASNLLGNALNYGTPATPVEFVAGMDGSDFVLTVANQGKAMTTSVMARIFQPFERVGEKRSLQGWGWGCTSAIRLQPLTAGPSQ